jgi:hypothetical protein
MQVQIQKIEQKQVFKPVTVALNFENKADFDMFFDIVAYDHSIPEIVSSTYSDLGRKHEVEVYQHCKRMIQSIHSAMREHRCK